MLLYFAAGVCKPCHLASRVKLIFELVLNKSAPILLFDAAFWILTLRIGGKRVRTWSFHFGEHFFSKSYFFVLPEFALRSLASLLVPIRVRNINRSRLVFLHVSFLFEETYAFRFGWCQVLDVVRILSHRYSVCWNSKLLRFLDAYNRPDRQILDILE